MSLQIPEVWRLKESEVSERTSSSVYKQLGGGGLRSTYTDGVQCVFLLLVTHE